MGKYVDFIYKISEMKGPIKIFRILLNSLNPKLKSKFEIKISMTNY